MFKSTMQELLNIEKIISLKIHLNQNQKKGNLGAFLVQLEKLDKWIS